MLLPGADLGLVHLEKELVVVLLRLGQHVRVLDSTYVLDSSHGDCWSERG